jgi:hypothetical protein
MGLQREDSRVDMGVAAAIAVWRTPSLGILMRNVPARASSASSVIVAESAVRIWITVDPDWSSFVSLTTCWLMATN